MWSILEIKKLLDIAYLHKFILRAYKIARRVFACIFLNQIYYTHIVEQPKQEIFNFKEVRSEDGKNYWNEDEEGKMQEPKKLAAQTTTGSTKKSLLSANSKRVFKPSAQKSKEKGFKVDEKGLLKITGFDDDLNLNFTNQLAELFKKLSERFKATEKMDTTTYIKTLHNMYDQHFTKSFKKTNTFNDEASSKIFPQIIRFMWDKKCIQGKFLTKVIENDIFDI